MCFICYEEINRETKVEKKNFMLKNQLDLLSDKFEEILKGSKTFQDENELGFSEENLNENKKLEHFKEKF